ncbi:hypothetical protein K438DRAFT_1746916 [Mycena galopus ATCC 62051]|nr:hypothetical protein K438DRAFT_1746916 [Mycena galopus ATCC 62051]
MYRRSRGSEIHTVKDACYSDLFNNTRCPVLEFTLDLEVKGTDFEFKVKVKLNLKFHLRCGGQGHGHGRVEGGILGPARAEGLRALFWVYLVCACDRDGTGAGTGGHGATGPYYTSAPAWVRAWMDGWMDGWTGWMDGMDGRDGVRERKMETERIGSAGIAHPSALRLRSAFGVRSLRRAQVLLLSDYIEDAEKNLNPFRTEPWETNIDRDRVGWIGDGAATEARSVHMCMYVRLSARAGGVRRIRDGVGGACIRGWRTKLRERERTASPSIAVHLPAELWDVCKRKVTCPGLGESMDGWMDGRDGVRGRKMGTDRERRNRPSIRLTLAFGVRRSESKELALWDVCKCKVTVLGVRTDRLRDML